MKRAHEKWQPTEMPRSTKPKGTELRCWCRWWWRFSSGCVVLFVWGFVCQREKCIKQGAILLCHHHHPRALYKFFFFFDLAFSISYFLLLVLVRLYSLIIGCTNYPFFPLPRFLSENLNPPRGLSFNVQHKSVRYLLSWEIEIAYGGSLKELVCD